MSLRDATYLCRGLVELVEEVARIGTEPLTLEEEVTYGRDDPVPWVFSSDKEYVLKDDFKTVQDLCKQCDITEDRITQWFGIANANRLRAKKLFDNGHLDISGLVVREAKMIVGGDKVVLFQAPVTASQRVRSYNTLLAYNLDKKQILRTPASSCDCVVHLGPGCSHQLCMVKHVVLFAMLTDSSQLNFLPSHVDALQRVAMTIEYAYGTKTIQRSAQDHESALVHVTANTANTATSTTDKRGRNAPTPIIECVRDQLSMWVARCTSVTAKDTRVKAVQDDTALEIAQFPRNPKDQLEADLMRERLYSAYIRNQVGGWEDTSPPLILYYLVHTRDSRMQRISNKSLPKKAKKVQPGHKRCPQCASIVRGCATCICPHCGKIFPGMKQPTVPKHAGNVRLYHELYDKLPGRWVAQPWLHSVKSDLIRVRNMGPEGMIGQYLEVLHEAGQKVKVRWNRCWRSAVVVEATLDKYIVTLTTAEGMLNVSVLRANVKDGDTTSSNSFFRIQKCERSVALVYGGGSKKFLHKHKGTWRLSPKSTTDRLVWTGGGHSGKECIVWIRQPTSRAVQPVYSARSSTQIASLPKKRKLTHYNQHCACGDRTCNSTQEQLGKVLVSRCRFPPPPTRFPNDSAIQRLPANKRRKLVRSKKLQDQIIAWRVSNKADSLHPHPAARVNELHYPMEFLQSLKRAGKKQIPSYVTIQFAKESGMYRDDLVVDDKVVVVPRLTREEACTVRGSTSVVPPPVITQPVIPATVPASAGRDESTKNVLVIGVMSHPPGSKLLDPSGPKYSETAQRDQARVDQLLTEFDTVFTMAPNRFPRLVDPDPRHHVLAKLGSGGARELVNLLQLPIHAQKKIHHIVLEYVRMPGVYYSNMVMGNNNGQVTIEFVQTLVNAGVLSSGCTMQFARHGKMDARWNESMIRIQDQLNTQLTYVDQDSNVLFKARRG